MHPLEKYLKGMMEDRATGATVPETSYYPHLRELLNEIGSSLSPQVRCVLSIRSSGIPDGGLFSEEQFRTRKDSDPIEGQQPSRGLIEVKSLREDVTAVAAGDQVARYWSRSNLVLVTNYRDFLLLGRGRGGQPEVLERFELAPDERAFWTLSKKPRRAAGILGDRLIDFLQRIMLQSASIIDPGDLAWFLASYAREARVRVEEAELPALDSLKEALEEALGMSFKGEKGEHFFRSTLVQTIFYGIFASWVLWSRTATAEDRFQWREASWSLHVPMVRSLFDQIATPSRLGPLNLIEVLEWTENALNRVVQEEFFQRFREDRSVQYFYEPFLEAFDPELRKELGVWYTPEEIVRYMVARVDQTLEKEFGLADGLADPNVFVLDPCCGTGTFLVEVLRKIEERLRESSGEDSLTAHDLKVAALSRIFGFEILPAPFVIAHLQIGLLLRSQGTPLSNGERAAVYLTNALTGWEVSEEPKQHLMFPELEEERDAAGNVKQEAPILVVLGNPPYNAYAGVSPEEEQGLVEQYKEGLISEWGIKKFNLDDLYIRFFRLAERRITEQTGRGIVSYITNFSYLSDPSFVVMRQKFLDNFDSIWIDCMNGDSRETGKLTPNGSPDPSVFSTAYNREGIRVGTAVCVFTKKEESQPETFVQFRHHWGVTKKDDLLASIHEENFESQYRQAAPSQENRYSFRPLDISEHYLKWPRVTDLCAIASSNGLMEKRGGALMDLDREALEQRMLMYYDPEISWEELESLGTGLTRDAASFPAQKTRKKVLKEEPFSQDKIKRYALRPFENVWCYYSTVSPLWNRSRPALRAQAWEGNQFLLSRFKASKKPEGSPFFFTPHLSDDHLLSPDASCFPIWYREAPIEDEQGDLYSDEIIVRANLSEAIQEYLAQLGFKNPDTNPEIAYLIWYHALAIGYSTNYLTDNTDGIMMDWPRIPFPNTHQALQQSAVLGEKIAGLLNTDNRVTGVTTGTVEQKYRSIGVISRVGGGVLRLDEGESALTAGWGSIGQSRAVMPGRGKVIVRDLSDDEVILGTGYFDEVTLDIYLNEVAYWKNIPEQVWEYRIGGHQVIKKWLSYRDMRVLSRPLTVEEVRYVTEMARRIAAIIFLEEELNENYLISRDNSFSVGR